MVRKLLAPVLILAMTLSAYAMASADNTRTSGLFTYTIKGNGSITIIDYNWEESSGDIYIPSMLDGYMVTSIGSNAFANGDSQRDKSLVIPSGITMIGDEAFLNTGFSTVSIPDSVMSIGTHAFNNVGKFIVSSSHSKYAVVEGALYEKAGKKLICYVPNAVIPEGITEIGAYAVDAQGDYTIIDYGKEKTRYGKALAGTLPGTVKAIGDYAFLGVDAMDGSSLPELDTIGIGAFAATAFRYPDIAPGQYCNGLKSVPGSLKQIPEYAFWGVNVRCIEDGVEEIGDYAFAAILPDNAPFSAAPRSFYFDEPNRVFYRKSANEPAYSLPSTLKRIGSYAFAGTLYGNNRDGETNSIFIPASVEYIGPFAFFSVDCANGHNCTKTIEISGNAAAIGEYAFSQIKNAYDGKASQEKGFDVIIGNGIRTLSKGIFQGTMIKTLQLPETLERIEEDAFSETASILSLDFPASLKEIGENAFKNSGLQNASVPDDSVLSGIGSNAFAGTSLVEFYIPAAVEYIGENAFDRTKITLIVEEGSYAALWAQENGYSYRFKDSGDDLDWLNN